MANARQRALLSALGIQQWIPRAVKTVSSSKSDANQLAHTTQLWRQGNDDFYIDSLDVNNHDSSIKHHLAKELDKILENQSDSVRADNISDNAAENFSKNHLENKQLSAFKADTAQLESVVLLQDAASEIVNENAPAPVSHDIRDDASLGNHVFDHEFMGDEFHHSPDHILSTGAASATISFRLQACEINQWIILIHEDDLQNSAMQTLWQNILKAFNQPEITQFSWPLSEGQRWQRSIGAKSALNGFLFRLGLDKRVGLMSELPDNICPDRLERLPHLAELLAEPLKKRALWHLLNTK